MSRGGFRRRGYGLRGFHPEGTAGGISGPRFPQPNFNQPRRGSRLAVDPWHQPPPPWQLNVAPYQNFVPRPPFRADKQYYHGHGGGGRAQKPRGGPGFSGARGRAVPMERRSRERNPQLEQPIGVQGTPEPPRVPALGSEEERRQKITETADKLKQKLSQITAVDTIHFWDDDFTILPTSEESAISNRGIPELKHEPPELNLTFNDFRDIGRVDLDTGTVSNDSIIILNEPLNKTEADAAGISLSEREKEAPRTEENIKSPTSGQESVIAVEPSEAAEQPAPPEHHPVSSIEYDHLLKSPSTQPQETLTQSEPPLSNPVCLPLLPPCKARFPLVFSPGSQPENERGHQLGGRSGFLPQTRTNFETGIDTRFQSEIGASYNAEINPGLQLRFDCRSEFRPRFPTQGYRYDSKLGGSRPCPPSQQQQHSLLLQQQVIKFPPPRNECPLRLPDSNKYMTLRLRDPSDQNEITVASVSHSCSPLPGLSISPTQSNPYHVPPFLLNEQLPSLRPPPPPPPATQENVLQQSQPNFERGGTYSEVSVASKKDKLHSQQSSASHKHYQRLVTQEGVLQLPSAFAPRLHPQSNSLPLAPIPDFNTRGPPSMRTIGLTDPSSIRFAQIPPSHMTLSQPSGLIPGRSTNFVPNLNPLYEIQPQVQQFPQGLTMEPAQVHPILSPPPVPTGALEIQKEFPKEPLFLSEFPSLETPSNPNMDDELEEMQEALEFAKQQIDMTSGEKSFEVHLPTCPDSPPMAVVKPTVGSCTPPCVQPESSLISDEGKIKERKSDTEKQDVNSRPQLIPGEQQKQHDGSYLNRGCDSILPEDQTRPKVIFNLHSKMKVISKSNEWQKQAVETASKSRVSKVYPMSLAASGDNSSVYPSAVEREAKVKGRENRVLFEATSIDGQDSLKEGKKGSERKSHEHTAGDRCKPEKRGLWKEQNRSPTRRNGYLTDPHRKERSQSRSPSPKSEGDSKQTEPHAKESRNSKLSSPKRLRKRFQAIMSESSWKNKVITRFLKMSKNDICNMVNNSSLRKFDIAMKHLVREKKCSLSQERRSSADEKVKGYDMSREEFMSQLSAMLDPSATVDVANLPTEFIHHLSEVLQLDLEPSQADTTVPIPGVKTEVNLRSGTDLCSKLDLSTMKMNDDELLNDAQELDKNMDSGLPAKDSSRNRSMSRMNMELDTSRKIQPTHDTSVSDSRLNDTNDMGALLPCTEVVKDRIINDNSPFNESQAMRRVECNQQNMATLDDIFTTVIAKTKLGRKSAEMKAIEPARETGLDELYPKGNNDIEFSKSIESETTAQKAVVDLDDIFSAGIVKAKLASLKTVGSKVTRKMSADHKSPSDGRHNERSMKNERWNRIKREDPDMFRNLTKEEWESKYGRPMDNVMERELRERRNVSLDRDLASTPTPVKCADSLRSTKCTRNNRPSRKCLSPSLARNRSPSVCLSRPGEIDMEHLREQHKDIEEGYELEQSFSKSDTYSSRSSSSCSSSSGRTSASSNSNITAPDVTKLLKVIKEQEKIAKTRSLNETIRDEVAAEIERAKRKERDRLKERRGQSKEKGKRKKAKKWRNVKMKRDRRKKKKRRKKRRRSVNSSESERANEDIPEQLLTEAEIKKEVEIKNEPGLELEQDVRSMSMEKAMNQSTEQAEQNLTAMVQHSHQTTAAVKKSVSLPLTASSQQKKTTPIEPPSLRNSITVSSQQTEKKAIQRTTQQRKTKAQLKEMPKVPESELQEPSHVSTTVKELQNPIQSTAVALTAMELGGSGLAEKQMAESSKPKRPATASQPHEENVDTILETKEVTAGSITKESGCATASGVNLPSQNTTTQTESQLSQSGAKKIDIGAYKARVLRKMKELEANPDLLTQNLLSFPCLSKRRSEEVEPNGETKLKQQQERLENDHSQQKQLKDPRLRKRNYRENTSAINKSGANERKKSNPTDPTEKPASLHMVELATSKLEHEENKQKGLLQKTTVEQSFQPPEPDKCRIKPKPIPEEVMNQSVKSESKFSNGKEKSTFSKDGHMKETEKSSNPDEDRLCSIAPRCVPIKKGSRPIKETKPPCTTDGDREGVPHQQLERNKEHVAPFSPAKMNNTVLKSEDRYPEKCHLPDQKEDTLKKKVPHILPKMSMGQLDHKIKKAEMKSDQLKRAEVAAEKTTGEQITCLHKEEQESTNCEATVNSDKHCAVLVKHSEQKRSKQANLRQTAGSTKEGPIKHKHQKKKTFDEKQHAVMIPSEPPTGMQPSGNIEVELYEKIEDSEQPSETQAHQRNQVGVHSQESLDATINESLTVAEYSQLKIIDYLPQFEEKVTGDEKVVTASTTEELPQRLYFGGNIDPIKPNESLTHGGDRSAVNERGNENIRVSVGTNESELVIEEDVVERSVDTTKTLEGSSPNQSADQDDGRITEILSAPKIHDYQNLSDESKESHSHGDPTGLSDVLLESATEKTSINVDVEINNESQIKRLLFEQCLPMVEDDTVIPISESHNSSFHQAQHGELVQCLIPIQGKHEVQTESLREGTLVNDVTMSYAIEGVGLSCKETSYIGDEFEPRKIIEDMPGLLLASADPHSQGGPDGSADQNEVALSNRVILNDVSYLETCRPATTGSLRLATKAQRKILPETTSLLAITEYGDISLKVFTEGCTKTSLLEESKLMHSDAIETDSSVANTIFRDHDASSNVETDDENLENIHRFVNDRTQNTVEVTQVAVDSTLNCANSVSKSDEVAREVSGYVHATGGILEAVSMKEDDRNGAEHDPKIIGNSSGDCSNDNDEKIKLAIPTDRSAVIEEHCAQLIGSHNTGGIKDTRIEDFIISRTDEPADDNVQSGGEAKRQRVTEITKDRREEEDFEKQNERNETSNTEKESVVETETAARQIGEASADDREVVTSNIVSEEDEHQIQDNMAELEECGFADFENGDFIVLSEITSEEDLPTADDDHPKPKEQTIIGMIKKMRTSTDTHPLELSQTSAIVKEASKSVSDLKRGCSPETSPLITDFFLKTENVEAVQSLPKPSKDILERPEDPSVEETLSDILQQEESFTTLQEHMVISHFEVPQLSQAERTQSDTAEQIKTLEGDTPKSCQAPVLAAEVPGVSQTLQITAVTSDIVQGTEIAGESTLTSPTTASHQGILEISHTCSEVPAIASGIHLKTPCTVESAGKHLPDSGNKNGALTNVTSMATCAIKLPSEDHEKIVPGDGYHAVEMIRAGDEPEDVISMTGTCVGYAANQIYHDETRIDIVKPTMLTTNDTTSSISTKSAPRNVENKFLRTDLEFQERQAETKDYEEQPVNKGNEVTVNVYRGSSCEAEEEGTTEVGTSKKDDDLEADLKQMEVALLKELSTSSSEDLSNVKRSKEDCTEVENIINMLQGKDTSYCMPIDGNILQNNTSVRDQCDLDWTVETQEDDVDTRKIMKDTAAFQEDNFKVHVTRSDFTTTAGSYITGNKIPFVELQKIEDLDTVVRAAERISNYKSVKITVPHTAAEDKPLNLRNEFSRDKHSRKIKRRMKHRRHELPKRKINMALKDRNLVTVVKKPQTKEAAMARMIEIDLEIHKLMTEKMNLYELLKNGILHTENVSAGGSEKIESSAGKVEEAGSIRPRTPAVLMSQLIQNLESGTTTSTQALGRSFSGTITTEVPEHTIIDSSIAAKRKSGRKTPTSQKSHPKPKKSIQIHSSENEEQAGIAPETRKTSSFKKKAKKKKERREKVDRSIMWDSAVKGELGSSTRETSMDRLSDTMKSVLKKETREDEAGREKIIENVNSGEKGDGTSSSSRSRKHELLDAKERLRSHTRKEIVLGMGRTEQTTERPSCNFGGIIENVSNDSAARPRMKNHSKVDAAVEELHDDTGMLPEAHARLINGETSKKGKNIKVPTKTRNAKRKTAMIITQDRAQIYSDESTQETIRAEPKKHKKGLALLEETFKREVARSRMLKIKDRKNKRRKLDNPLGSCNSQTMDKKGVRVHSQDITTLQRKRGLQSTSEIDPGKTEDTEKILEHMRAVIDAVAENRIEEYYVDNESRPVNAQKQSALNDRSKELIQTEEPEILNDKTFDSKVLYGIEEDSNGLVEETDMIASLPWVCQDIPGGSALVELPEAIAPIEMNCDSRQSRTFLEFPDDIGDSNDENAGSIHRDEILSKSAPMSRFDDVEDLIGNLPEQDEFDHQEGPLDEMEELCNVDDIIGTSSHIVISTLKHTMLSLDDINGQIPSNKIPRDKVLEISREFDEVDLDGDCADDEVVQKIVPAEETEFTDVIEELDAANVIKGIYQDSSVFCDHTGEYEREKEDERENHVSNYIDNISTSHKVNETSATSGQMAPHNFRPANFKGFDNVEDIPPSMLKEVNRYTSMDMSKPDLSSGNLPSAEAINNDSEPIGAKTVAPEQMERTLQGNKALNLKARKTDGKELALIPLRRSSRQLSEKNQNKRKRVRAREDISRKRLRSTSSPTLNIFGSPSENTEDSGNAKKKRTGRKQCVGASVIARRRSTFGDSETSSIDLPSVSDLDERALESHVLKEDPPSKVGKRKTMSLAQMMSCKVKLVDIKHTYLRHDLNPSVLQTNVGSVMNFQAAVVKEKGMPELPIAEKIITPHDHFIGSFCSMGQIVSARKLPIEESRAAIQTVDISKTRKTIPHIQGLIRRVPADSTEEAIEAKRTLDTEMENQDTINPGEAPLKLRPKTQAYVALKLNSYQKSHDSQSTAAQISHQRIAEIPEADTSRISSSQQRPCLNPMESESSPGRAEGKPHNSEVQIVEERNTVSATSSQGDIQTLYVPTDNVADSDVEEVEQPRKQYTSHKGPILYIKVFENSFLAASEDGIIYRYCLETDTLLNTYRGHTAAVTCLYVLNIASSDTTQEWLFSGSVDGSLRCYSIKTGSQVRNTVEVGSEVHCMDQSWGIIYLGTKSGHVTRYHIKSDAIKEERIKFSEKTVLALKATTEGPRRVLIVASRSQPITIRDAQNGLFLRTLSGEKSHTVYTLMMESNLVYCGTSSTTIPVFDFINGNQIAQYNSGAGIVCMRMYRKILFAGCYDGNIYVYDTVNQKLVCSIPGPGNLLLSMEIVKSQIIAGSKDKRLQMWQMPTQVLAVLNR